MSSISVLLLILVVQAAVLVGALIAFLVHGWWLWWFRQWSAPRLARAQDALVEALVAMPGGPEGEGTLSLSAEQLHLSQRLPSGLQVRLLYDLARNLSGVGRRQVAALADELGLTSHAELQCRSRFWWRRLQGARLLTFIGAGDDIMPWLLRDPHPVVRAQAADWAADHPTPLVITRLLRLLADEETFSRFAVQDALLRMGGVAVEPLIDYIYSHSDRSLEVALTVAIGLADSRFLAPALLLCRDESPQVRALAASLVGSLGGTEGVETLTSLLQDPAAEVRAAVARALGKLAHWQAAPTLVTLLRDRFWIVRREAGLALRAFGAPGTLFLKRALADHDYFAADMARQVLDLPGTTGSVSALAH